MPELKVALSKFCWPKWFLAAQPPPSWSFARRQGLRQQLPPTRGCVLRGLCAECCISS